MWGFASYLYRTGDLVVAKKAELELAHETYQELIRQARQAKDQGQFGRAIDLAMQCWSHLDAMMRYAQKYQERQFESLECIELVLELAPPLFHFEALDALAALLKQQRRIDKQASADLAGKLTDARARMWEAHRAWGAMDSQSTNAANGFTPTNQKLTAFWVTTGACVQSPGGAPRLAFDGDRLVRVKCSSCGATGKAKFVRVLADVLCPRCKTSAPFVVLGEDSV